MIPTSTITVAAGSTVEIPYLYGYIPSPFVRFNYVILLILLLVLLMHPQSLSYD
jgi:hypothetical protein